MGGQSEAERRACAVSEDTQEVAQHTQAASYSIFINKMEPKQTIRFLFLLIISCGAVFSQVLTNNCDLMSSERAKKLCREQTSSNINLGRNELDQFSLDGPIDSRSPDYFGDLDDESEHDEEQAKLEEALNAQIAEELSKLSQPANITKTSGPKIYIEEVKKDHYDEDLPDCMELPEKSRKPELNCKEVQVSVKIIRYRDPVFERLLPQVWSDTQKKMRFDRELHGVVVDPLQLGNQSQSVSNPFATIDIELYDIQVHGLSNIYLLETLVTRATDLSDLNMKMSFQFEELLINGSYSSTGTYGVWPFGGSLDSGGLQKFEIRLSNATVSPNVLVNSTEQNKFGCGEGDGSVYLDVTLPMIWSSLTVEFDKIGSVVNSVLNIAATALINSQEQDLVAMMKETIKDYVNSLICDPVM